LEEARLLRQVIKSDFLTERKQLILSALDFIQKVNCDLTFQISAPDKGIVQENDGIFTCYLPKSFYEEMIFLMEPFCNKESGGYQWLYGWGATDSDIEFLFSPFGSW